MTAAPISPDSLDIEPSDGELSEEAVAAIAMLLIDFAL